MIMKKKTILIVLSAVLLVAGSFFTWNAVRERSISPILNANVEALLEPEAFQRGKGESWDYYSFSINALFLHWDTCIYLYGIPTYPWLKHTC